MLRSVLAAPGRIELEETATPSPGRGEVLLAVRTALTCGTDLKAYRRGHPLIPMPGPFGHEFSGVAAAVGAGVRRFKEGDPLMAVHSAPCLACPYCRKRLHHFCQNIMRTKILGAFADYVLLPAHVVRQNAHPKPPKLPFEEAALLEPLACVVHGLRRVRLRPGDAALVVGGGPIGLLHALLLSHRGVWTAVADKHPSRLSAAGRLGASATHRVTDPLIPPPRELAPGGLGFDAVFECTGRPEVWKTALSALRRGGTLVLFGGCPPGTRVCYDTGRLHYDEMTLAGSFHFTPADVRVARDLLAGRKLPVSGLISGTYPLARLETALKRLARGQGIKYAIVPPNAEEARRRSASRPGGRPSSRKE